MALVYHIPHIILCYTLSFHNRMIVYTRTLFRSVLTHSTQKTKHPEVRIECPYSEHQIHHRRSPSELKQDLIEIMDDTQRHF